MQHINRELTLESDASADEVIENLNNAIKDGALLTLTDTKGRTLVIQADKLAYVDIGAANSRHVGFAV